MMLGKSSSKSIGLDIGTYSIKLTAIEMTGVESKLTNYNIKDIPPDAKSSQREKLIKDIFEEIDLVPDYINVSISGPDVIVRFIDFPNMTKEQLNNALVFEAEKYIPFNVNEVMLDSIILGEGDEKGQMRVLLAAAKKEPIENMVKTMENMGIGINCIDIDPFAMFNAYFNTIETPQEESAAFLMLGYSTTDVLIAMGEQPCFMRQIQIAGKDVAESISKNLSVTVEEAEKLKIADTADNREKIFQATVPVLEDLIREMQLSFGYFENRYNKNIKSIFCSGGMVYQHKILEYLSSKLGVEVNQWDPLKGFKIDETISKEDIMKISSLLTVSLGLSLRG